MCNLNKLKEFSPVSLRNFIGKIISKILSTRLSHILRNSISFYQSCFVNGIIITENIMLGQEITHQIIRPNIGSNFTRMLDMTKAYERFCWAYIYLILRKMGFEKTFIDMMWRTKLIIFTLL